MAQNINLLTELPIQTTSALGSKLIAQISIGWILFLILIYIIAFGINSNRQHNLTNLEITQKNLLAKIDAYNKELTPFQGDMNLGSLPTGSGNLLGFYRYFEDLAVFTPHGVWLNSISISETDGTIVLKGSSIAASSVSEFIYSLSQSDDFHNKIFGALQLEKIPNSNFTDFTIGTFDTNPTTTMNKK